MLKQTSVDWWKTAAELMKRNMWVVKLEVIRQMKMECIKNPSIHSHNLDKNNKNKNTSKSRSTTFLFSQKVRNELERDIHSRYQCVTFDRGMFPSLPKKMQGIALALAKVQVVRYVFLVSLFKFSKVVHGALAVLRLAFKRNQTSVNRWETARKKRPTHTTLRRKSLWNVIFEWSNPRDDQTHERISMPRTVWKDSSSSLDLKHNFE